MLSGAETQMHKGCKMSLHINFLISMACRALHTASAVNSGKRVIN